MRKYHLVTFLLVLLFLLFVGCSESHIWLPADCTTPQMCSECSESKGEPLGHRWNEATCLSPKYCNVCGATEGNALGHEMKNDGEISRCIVCGKEEQILIRLSVEKANKVLNEEFEKLTDLITELSNLLDYYMSNEFTTIDDIREYEAMWQDMADSATAIGLCLTENRPPEKYDADWLAFRNCVQEISSILLRGTNMDCNNDGTYSDEEMRGLIEELSTELIVLFQEAIDIAVNIGESDSETNEVESQYNTSSESIYSCLECGRNASRTYTNPFSGKLEHYCETHYQEIIELISGMEKDVGTSTQSKRTCEVCSREGTHRYDSFTGQTEYYCTKHYEELKDMLSSFGVS